MKVAVQCVPSRARSVASIKDKITSLGVEVKPYMDFDHKGTMWNFTRIINDEDYIKDDHLLILQDDVIFSESFDYSVFEVLEYMKSNSIGCVSLFSPPRKYYKEEHKKGTKYYVEKNYLWQPAIILSPSFRKGLIDYKFETTHDDCFVGSYAKENKDYVQVTIPSLVRHDLDIKSTLGTPAKIGKLVRDTYIFHPVEKNYFL